MNERIQELMDQCEEKYSTQNYPCWDMEKFALLIIKECAEVSVLGDSEYSAQYAILKHFGVEE